jgi:hypothetical protein
MRCPVCKAPLEAGPQCRRCRADLSLLFTLAQQRAHAIRAAGECLRRGKPRHALAIAAGVEALKYDADSLRLRALVHLVEGNFAEALSCYQTRQRLCASLS